MKIVLASGSKQRKEILDLAGIEYEIVKSNVEEFSDAQDPREYVKDLSRDKANSVCNMLKENALVIAADTVIYMDGKIFEKPKDKQEAYKFMKDMSGKITYGTTGITIKDMYKNKEITFADSVEVHIKNLTDEEIKWYVENDNEILNRCGYSIHGKATFFIEKVVGDYNTVIGLSLSKIYDKLKLLGYSLNDLPLKK